MLVLPPTSQMIGHSLNLSPSLFSTSKMSIKPTSQDDVVYEMRLKEKIAINAPTTVSGPL